MSFTHLHVHSDYSILDSSITIPDLVAEAKSKGMKALALTDHGNVHGLVQFYTECEKQGIKPILGCEIYVARRNARAKMDREHNPTDHLVLLARDFQGYQNILSMVSWAYQNGMHYVPRVDLATLAEHSKGIIALTACLSGGVNRLLRGWEHGSKEKGTYREFPSDFSAAAQLAGDFRSIFGPDGFFLEVQHHAGQHENPELLAKQRKLAEQSFKLATHMQVPLIATNDIHFKGPEDAAAREIAYMIARGKISSEDSGDKVNHAAEFYVKSAEEMKQAFLGWPEYLLDNTQWIVDQCNVKLALKGNHFATPIDDDGEMTPERVKATWDTLVNQGFSVRYGEHYPKRQEAWDRILYEKAMIEKMGFVPYFLVVADFIRYAKRNGISVGPGRGSVGGCAIAYCLGITDLDPLEYDLLFERFLNPERVSMPDIDVDFDKDRVQEVMEYVTKKYGRDRVARISAFGKMWAKQALNDVGRLLEIPMEEIRLITSELPDAQGEFRMSISDAMETVPEVIELANSPDERKRKLLNLAKGLEGIKRTVTTHACGIVIGDSRLEAHCALMPVKDEDYGGILQSQLDMESLEALGLLKYDFLALDTLTIISRAERMIRKRRGIEIDVNADRSRSDKLTYKMLAEGRTVGVFQIEKPGMREVTMLVRPQCLEDVALILALYRPGPLDAKDERGLTMVDHYVLRRSGKEEVTYPHPSLEPVLKSTYGILIYQEQIMRMSQVLCGYTLGRADILRKAVGKKKPELIKKEKETFIPSAVKHAGITEVHALQIWDMIETFARYGFNKPHAVGYAVLTYQTMFLKAHFPVEYLASTLSAACGYTEPEFRDMVPKKSKNEGKVRRLIDEANRLGLKVLNANVNMSEEECVVVDDSTIRMGLCSVKGIGSNSGKIISARTECGGKFTTFKKLVASCRAADVDSGTLQSMIDSGACDDMGERNHMKASLEENIASAKESLKYGAGISPFVPIPEVFAPTHPMAETQRQALTLDLVGAYDIKKQEPLSVGVVVNDEQNLTDLAVAAQANPGPVKLFVQYAWKAGERQNSAFFEFGTVSGDEHFLLKLEKYGKVAIR